MPERLYRTQILLEPEQHQALTEIAEQEDRSLSDLVREILRDYLEQLQEENKVQQGLEALQRLKAIREETRQRYGVYQGNIVDEIREERDEEIDRIRRGQE